MPRRGKAGLRASIPQAGGTRTFALAREIGKQVSSVRRDGELADQTGRDG
jgi:hypothetical protein